MNCYVLTGGHSRRMGQSKVGLFLDRVVAAARVAFDDVIAVQRPDGETLAMPTIFESRHEGEGPVFGVERALDDARASCFVIAVDYPLITADMLRYLRERCDAEMIVPMWRGKPQTLCAGYSAALLPRIRARIASGRFDLRGLLEEADARIIDESELRARFTGEPLLNVNTPEELQEAKVLDERILASR